MRSARTYHQGNDKMKPSSTRDEVMAVVRDMIRDNPDATRTYAAICNRGRSKKWAQEEIARALMGCTWEASRGLPDRWEAVLKGLEEGKSATSLFPDELYADVTGPRQ